MIESETVKNASETAKAKAKMQEIMQKGNSNAASESKRKQHKALFNSV